VRGPNCGPADGSPSRDHGMTIRDDELLARLRALGSKVARPLAAPEAKRVAGADEAVRLLGLPEDELTPTVRAALQHLIAELALMRDELVSTRSRLAEAERLADEDELAPIANRRAFLRHLARTIGYIERYRTAASLLYFDLNGLKAINDRFGHAAGDAALIHVARVLIANTRSSDLVGRLGGDEFGVILARAEASVAAGKAERLAAAVAGSALELEGRRLPVTLAHGTHGLRPGESVADALAAADRAMYAHKRAHRGDTARAADQRGKSRPSSR
jgi:diguanylate cyclase (GGDEF)-like protein